jgi:hypothetical protein
VVCYSVISFPNDGMAPSRKRDCLGENDEQATKLTPSAAGGPLTFLRARTRCTISMGFLAAALNRFGDLKGALFFLLQVVCYSVEIFCSNDGMAPSRKRGCLGESDEQATKLTPSAAGGPLTISASENAMHNLNGFFGCRVAANLWGRGRRVTARGTAGAAAVEGAATKAAMVGAAMVGAAAGAAGRTCSGSIACRCASAPLRPNHLLLQNYII